MSTALLIGGGLIVVLLLVAVVFLLGELGYSIWRLWRQRRGLKRELRALRDWSPEDHQVERSRE